MFFESHCKENEKTKPQTKKKQVKQVSDKGFVFQYTKKSHK